MPWHPASREQTWRAPLPARFGWPCAAPRASSWRQSHRARPLGSRDATEARASRQRVASAAAAPHGAGACVQVESQAPGGGRSGGGGLGGGGSGGGRSGGGGSGGGGSGGGGSGGGGSGGGRSDERSSEGCATSWATRLAIGNLRLSSTTPHLDSLRFRHIRSHNVTIKYRHIPSPSHAVTHLSSAISSLSRAVTSCCSSERISCRS